MSAQNLDFVLIPTADFFMGSDQARDAGAHVDEFPGHVLHVTDYYIMRYPVTNAQYLQFIQDTGHRQPLFWTEGAFPAGKENHPVVGVSFRDAVAFCKWAGEKTGFLVRLPSEPEWEKAARGSDARLYPWGNDWKPGVCNTSEAKSNGTSSVGQYSPAGDSPYGVAEMGGNVQEWCSSLFGPYPYDPTDGRETLVYDLEGKELLPRQSEMGTTSVIESMEAGLGKTVIRGGSWRESKHQARCAYRSWSAPMHRSDDTGFRCCYEPVKNN